VIKKNLILYYPSFEKGGVEENIKNLINNLHNNFKIFLITSLTPKESKKIFKKNCKILKIEKSKYLSFLPDRFNSALVSMITLFKLLNSVKHNLVVHSMQSNIAAIIICLIKNVKIVIRNSEDPISSTFHSENLFTSTFVFFLKFIFYNLCDSIITNSEGSRKSLGYFVINKNKIKTIYNPYLKNINSKNFKKKNIIINIGRLRKQKNQILLIRAFYKFNKVFKNYELHIYGQGSFYEILSKEIIKLKLGNKVFLKGWKKNVNNYLKFSKLFVLSSLYEGLGNVLIDSINYNVPCVSTNCKSGPNEILLKNRGGYLAKNNDIDNLANKMIIAIKNYKISVKKKNIAKKSLNRFLISNQVEKYKSWLLKFENF